MGETLVIPQDEQGETGDRAMLGLGMKERESRVAIQGDMELGGKGVGAKMGSMAGKGTTARLDKEYSGLSVK